MTRSEMEEMFREVGELSRHLAEVTPLEVDRTRQALCTVLAQARLVYLEILRSVKWGGKGSREERERAVRQLDEVYREAIAPIARHNDEAKLRVGVITRDLYDHRWGRRW